MDVSSQVELYDSDILAMEKGPLRWMQNKRGTRMNLESFRRAVVEQFEMIGFVVDVKCWETDADETYAFDVDIRRRIEKVSFDYDRMRHEVINNILEIPGQVKGELLKGPTGAEARRIAKLKPHKH